MKSRTTTQKQDVRAASVSRSEVQGLGDTADLAAESLRTTLRYQAGEATALEVVDA